MAGVLVDLCVKALHTMQYQMLRALFLNLC